MYVLAGETAEFVTLHHSRCSDILLHKCRTLAISPSWKFIVILGLTNSLSTGSTLTDFVHQLLKIA